MPQREGTVWQVLESLPQRKRQLLRAHIDAQYVTIGRLRLENDELRAALAETGRSPAVPAEHT